eukprot:CAMPEP_0175071488 /NCGR_PEP_ID=MMETSP0052_2-20121109/19273_1 /TAXON_ID=51329 ORGANISM="Polytomella parva, Strain SAG 63-3" /NCGR_SAMPLE_ID=MMETSP0052_2 /ASSEMBLY_ACC=CAM_ASM_000194 /LENGTH=948 /DNA_ID=CAMNT_0016338669 /DNA_START=224 /DNA_END=3070 /DNA_ORIENTATION=-
METIEAVEPVTTEVQAEEEKSIPHEPTLKYRKDYKQPSTWVSSVDLTFNLGEDVTIVTNRSHFRPNYPEDIAEVPPVKLDGRKDAKLVSIRVNGTDLPSDTYKLTERDLTLLKLPRGEFDLEVVTEIKPQDNSLLEGLYKSSGNFCTQCEAEGFRGITFALDRPDVMAKYTTRIEADKTLYPVLLSNGNLMSSGDVEGSEGKRHFTVWEDPFPKPCYLFALVAGQLECRERSFRTASGREVKLRIFVQAKNIGLVDHALESLIRAMEWDERTFGLEYDLDLFNIVAVDDFNMGAMENKSLNIFNSRLVLASPETATDGDYARIESVVGHEYFHNWTGNRVTCRDWFQLTLKEGLTVFRDQEFSADVNSRAVKRIEDVMILRASQFSQDAGPLAHPIRPDSYIKMDNFYTVTVYEKGSEIIRLYHTLLGKSGFRKGMDLYFKRHDGNAVTCDDFLAAMADANNVDLSTLSRWYSQAGTPHLTVTPSYDESAKTFSLHCKQSTPSTPGQDSKLPVLIPIKVGLLGVDGKDLALSSSFSSPSSPSSSPSWSMAEDGVSAILRFETEEATFVFHNVDGKPVPSLLRGFSAPVKMEVVGQTDSDLLFLFAHDSDPFCRWEAGQILLKKLLVNAYHEAQLKLQEAGHVSAATVSDDDAIAAAAAAVNIPSEYIQAFRNILEDKSLDGMFQAMAVCLPSATELIDKVPAVDPVLLHAVCAAAAKAIAQQLRPLLESLAQQHSRPAGHPYAYSVSECSRRALKNKSFLLLSELDDPSLSEAAMCRLNEATNMTDEVASLAALLEAEAAHKSGLRQEALDKFFQKFQDQKLVMLKWLGLQAASNRPGNLAAVQELTKHASFSLQNPNCCYSLILGFARSPVNFHRADGSGYKFLADMVLEVDKVNHQVAARIVSPFANWRQYDSHRQGLMKAQLERIMATTGLSDNVFELASKSLAP